MNSSKLKQTLVTLTFGLATLLGMNGIASAQNRQHPPQKNDDQRRAERRSDDSFRTLERLERHQEYLQRDIIEQQQIDVARIEQQQEENRLQNQGNVYRVIYNDRPYQMDYDGAELLKQAVNSGYQEGVKAGKNDHHEKRAADFNSSIVYQAGNYGYQNSVDADLYQFYFREGFQRGYEDGYNNHHQYGKSTNGIQFISDAVMQSILNLQQI